RGPFPFPATLSPPLLHLNTVGYACEALASCSVPMHVFVPLSPSLVTSCPPFTFRINSNRIILHQSRQSLLAVSAEHAHFTNTFQFAVQWSSRPPPLLLLSLRRLIN